MLGAAPMAVLMGVRDRALAVGVALESHAQEREVWLAPQAEALAVEADRADALYRSLEQGELTTIESADTFADGLATRSAFEVPFSIVKDQVDRMVRVTEDEMRMAVRLALETTHNVAEGAAAAAYAAAEKLHQELAGKRVVLIHTGQNIDRDTLRWALGLYDFDA